MTCHSNPAGRPKTKTPEFYRRLLDSYNAYLRWYVQTRGRAPVSDVELVEAIAQKTLKDLGMRSELINNAKSKARMKTIRNQISEARKHVRTNPVESLLSN